MLGVFAAERIEPLAAELAARLAVAPDDPFATEWIAVPSAGMQRWLALELARHLGASRPGLDDGVTANVHWAFPGSLRAAVVGASPEDPWQPDRSVWAILSVLEGATDDPQLADLAPGTGTPRRRYGRARRIADRFDRYDIGRPEMIRAWAAGEDVDDTGAPLPDHHRWQPHLWRRIRAVLGTPSPAELLPRALAEVHEGTRVLDLPSRLCVFGVALLPGGAGFLPVARAVARHHQLDVYLLEPSHSASRAARAAAGPPAGRPPTRAEDRTHEAVHHPLARTWGRLHRETAVLLAGQEPVRLEPAEAAAGRAGPAAGGPVGALAAPATLLDALQRDIRANRAPAGAYSPSPDDRSVEIHACYGPARQVEVLRDALLHALADDPTLTEDDILVVCPAIEQFAPLVEAAFGPPASGAGPDPTGAPRLRYRIADRSLRAANPAADTFLAFVEVATGRVDAAGLLDLCGRPAVRARFGFSADDLDRIADWITQAGVRWGLDPGHRAGFGLSDAITGGSWQRLLDRILIGVALADDGGLPAFGDLLPIDVEGDTAALAGRLADLVSLVAGLADAAATERPVHQWIGLLREALDDVMRLDRDAAWQRDALHRVLDTLAAAAPGAPESGVPVSALDMRRILDAYVTGFPGRPDYFRGGITVCSLTPLRWIPHRVVCILGFDHGAFGAAAPDGDDVVQPAVGDRDPRAESRQALLETVLSARDRLVVLRDGHDVRTNQPVPEAVPLAELHDALRATLHPDALDPVDQRLTIDHPCRPQDERCFSPGALHPTRSWGFDPHEFAAARARRQRPERGAPRPWLRTPLPALDQSVVTLDTLQQFLAKPTERFLRDRVGLRLTERAEAPPTALTVVVSGLDQWALGEELLGARRAGAPVEVWRARALASGAVPDGVLGSVAVTKAESEVDALVAAAHQLGFLHGAPTRYDLATTLADGTRVEAALDVMDHGAFPGPALVTFSRPKPAQELSAWLQLAMLTAHDPDRRWCCTVITRAASATKKKGSLVRRFHLRPTPDPAATARTILDVALHCYRRGMCEPLPLFPQLSRALVMDPPSAGPGLWRGSRNSPADGDDPAHRLAFGEYDYDDLLTIDARADDPGTSGSRTERWAHHLWGTVRDTLETEDVAP